MPTQAKIRTYLVTGVFLTSDKSRDRGAYRGGSVSRVGDLGSELRGAKGR
jgi:hypothetical protein